MMLFSPVDEISIRATPEAPGVTPMASTETPDSRERIAQLLAEEVIADIAEHRGWMTQTRGGDGLIRALAAVKRAEGVADQSFAGTGYGGCAGDQVQIDAANDDDGLAHLAS